MKKILLLAISLCCIGTTVAKADDSVKRKNKESIPITRVKGIERKVPLPEPIRYTISSSTRNVSYGEEFTLKISIRFFKISPSSLFTEVPVENRIRVVFPEGFVQTGGDFYDDVLCLVNEGNPIQEWTIRGKFISGEGVRKFSLIRTDGSLSENTWIAKDHLTVKVLKGKDAGREAATSTYSQCIESESTPSHSGGSYSNAGASGGVAMWSYSNQSEYIDYTFSSVPTAGNYTFKLRYSTAESPVGGLVVNGGTAQSLSLPTTSTTSWYVYSEISVTVSLTAGTNTIRVRGGSGGSFHQDKACLEGTSGACSPPAAPTVSASATSITPGQSVTLNASGCSGTVTWKDGGGNIIGTSGAQSVTPSGTTTYTATCTVSGCESASSGVTVTVTTGSSTYSQCIESESTPSHSGGSYSNAGASGGVAMWSYSNQSEYIDYTFSSVPTAGNYTFKLRYSTAESPVGGLVVNGGTAQSLSLPTTSTTSWYVYSEISVTVSLTAGTNTIRVRGGSGGSFHQDKACLEGTSGACSPPAAPTVSASATSITPGQSVTLNASGCSGTVTWKDGGGNIIGTSGAQITITPSTTTTYLAVCTIGNCSSGNSSTLIVSVGNSTGTVVPAVSITNEPWGETIYIKTPEIEAGIGLGKGGSIVSFRDAAHQYDNIVDNFDQGRQIQQSFYAGPQPFVPPGQTQHPAWAGFPWNAVQAGDAMGNVSQILAYQLPSSSNNWTLYVKSLPFQWALNGYQDGSYMESWYKFETNDMLSVRFKITTTRNDGYTDANTDGQEGAESPAMWLNRNYDQFYAAVDGSPIGSDPILMNNNTSGFYPTGSGPGSPLILVLKEYYTAILNSSGIGMGWIAKDYVGLGETKNFLMCNATLWGQKGSPQHSGPSTYFSPGQFNKLYGYTTAEYSFYLTFGNVAKIKQRYQQFGMPYGGTRP